MNSRICEKAPLASFEENHGTHHIGTETIPSRTIMVHEIVAFL